MTKRERVYEKFNGLCAYSGTILEDDWQIDHIEPIFRLKTKWHGVSGCLKKNEDFDNLIPCQKIINHYKRAYTLEGFRNLLLGGLHLRLKKLPKKSKCLNTIKRKEYLLKVASYFGITEEKPFCGRFYFEIIKDK